MDVLFAEVSKRFNFYQEGTKLVCFKCYTGTWGTHNAKLSGIKVGTSIGLYSFTFHVRPIYDGIRVKLEFVTPYIISNNTISKVNPSAYIINSSPYIFDILARIKLSGVSEVNIDSLLGGYMYNAKEVYDNQVVSIKDAWFKEYRLSILVYWSKKGKIHFAPYAPYALNSPYSSSDYLDSLLNSTDNYKEVIRKLLRRKRPKAWDDGAYFIYEAIISNFDISWL